MRVVHGSILPSTQSESAYLEAIKQQKKENTMSTPIPAVTKLNRGTSRTEYGVLNYWGYKTPDGLIRARVTPPEADGGDATFEVRYYDQTNLQNTWRKRLDWDSATVICSSYISVADAEKGPAAKDMISEVNALIEIYNDSMAKHVGRKVVRTKEYMQREQYGSQNDDRLNPWIITGVEISFGADTVLTTKLLSKSDRYSPTKWDLDDVEDFAADSGKAAVREQIAEYRKRVDVSTAYLDMLEDAVDTDKEVAVPGYGSEKVLGVLPNNLMGVVVKALNESLPKPVETTV